MATTIFKSLGDILLPKGRGVKDGRGYTPTFDPRNTLLTAPLYRDHLSDVYTSRVAGDVLPHVAEYIVIDLDPLILVEIWIDRNATSRIFLELARKKAASANQPEQQKIASLTRRERQTIAALASDASAPGKLVAERLHISEHTLRNHLTSIYGKLAVSNRLALYAYAQKHGLTKSE